METNPYEVRPNFLQVKQYSHYERDPVERTGFDLLCRPFVIIDLRIISLNIRLVSMKVSNSKILHSFSVLFSTKVLEIKIKNFRKGLHPGKTKYYIRW